MVLGGMEGPEFQEHTVARPKKPSVLSGREYKRCYGCSLDFDYSYVSINNHIEVFLPHLLPLQPFSPYFSVFLFFSACTHN